MLGGCSTLSEQGFDEGAVSFEKHNNTVALNSRNIDIAVEDALYGYDKKIVTGKGKNAYRLRHVTGFLETQEAKAIKKSELIVVGDFINATSSNIDTTAFAAMITDKLRDLHKFRVSSVVAGSGGIDDSAVDKVRALKDDKRVDQRTTVEDGDIKAPSYIITGRITDQVKYTSKGKARHEYYLVIKIVNAQKVEVWGITINMNKAQGR